VIFILMDDLGQRDLGCYGSKYYKTPHIDQLAATGLKRTPFARQRGPRSLPACIQVNLALPIGSQGRPMALGSRSSVPHSTTTCQPMSPPCPNA
jgi:hypothetical protein